MQFKAREESQVLGMCTGLDDSSWFGVFVPVDLLGHVHAGMHLLVAHVRLQMAHVDVGPAVKTGG